MPTLADLALGPDIGGAIGRGLEIRGVRQQISEADRRRRRQENIDRLFAKGIPADPGQRQTLEEKAFALGGAEAGLQVRQLFQQMSAEEQAQTAREGRMVATALAGVRDQPTYERALSVLQGQGLNTSSLPAQFDAGTVGTIVNLQREIENIVSPDTATLSPGQSLVDVSTGRTIANVPTPEDQGGPNATVANQLRDEFVKQTDEFVDVQAAFRKVDAAANTDSGPGDMAILVGFMKIIDPGSVVREGEFATAEQAQGVGPRVLNLYNRVVRGERLTPETRQAFVQAARDQFETYIAGYDQAVQTYSGLAQRFGLDPANVVINRRLEDSRPTSEPSRDIMPSLESMPRPTTQEGYDALPDGAWYIDPDTGQPARKGR